MISLLHRSQSPQNQLVQWFLCLWRLRQSSRMSYNNLGWRLLFCTGLKCLKMNCGVELPLWRLSQRPQESHYFAWRRQRAWRRRDRLAKQPPDRSFGTLDQTEASYTLHANMSSGPPSSDSFHIYLSHTGSFKSLRPLSVTLFPPLRFPSPLQTPFRYHARLLLLLCSLRRIS